MKKLLIILFLIGIKTSYCMNIQEIDMPSIIRIKANLREHYLTHYSEVTHIHTKLGGKTLSPLEVLCPITESLLQYERYMDDMSGKPVGSIMKMSPRNILPIILDGHQHKEIILVDLEKAGLLSKKKSKQ